LNLGDANRTGCPLVKDCVQKRTASPITDEEKLWQKGDIEALDRYIEKKQNILVPQLPSYRYAYNRPVAFGSHGLRSVESRHERIAL
jgi:hypothetical protein